MAKAGKGTFEVGFGKPPRSTQFKPGQSGNPAGRRRGARNFATAIEEELAARVTVTENGRRRRISKREVIAKHLVNKSATGDLKAILLLLNEARARQTNAANPAADAVLDTPEDRRVFDGIIARIRNSVPQSQLSSPENGTDAVRTSDETEE